MGLAHPSTRIDRRNLLTAEQRDIHENWERMCREKGICSDPDFKTMKKNYKTRKKRIAIKRHVMWVEGLCKEAAEIADNGGSTKRLYQIAKILSKKGKT